MLHPGASSGQSRRQPMITLAQAQPETEEKRGAIRHPVMVQGKIVSAASPVYCAVREIAATGARLELGADVELPARFDLLLVKAELTVKAELKWRRDDAVGIAFERALSEAELEAAKPQQPLGPGGRRPR